MTYDALLRTAAEQTHSVAAGAEASNNQAPTWNLTDLFAGFDDPEIEAILAAAAAEAEAENRWSRHSPCKPTFSK